MEIVNGIIAKIYERDRDQDTTRAKFVVFNHLTTITQFPSLLMGKNNANFLFTPNFDRYIDVMYHKKQFCIRHVNFLTGEKTSSDDEKNVTLIPKDIISMNGFGDASAKEIV